MPRWQNPVQAGRISGHTGKRPPSRELPDSGRSGITASGGLKEWRLASEWLQPAAHESPGFDDKAMHHPRLGASAQINGKGRNAAGMPSGPGSAKRYGAPIIDSAEMQQNFPVRPVRGNLNPATLPCRFHEIGKPDTGQPPLRTERNRDPSFKTYRPAPLPALALREKSMAKVSSPLRFLLSSRSNCGPGYSFPGIARWENSFLKVAISVISYKL